MNEKTAVPRLAGDDSAAPAGPRGPGRASRTISRCPGRSGHRVGEPREGDRNGLHPSHLLSSTRSCSSTLQKVPLSAPHRQEKWGSEHLLSGWARPAGGRDGRPGLLWRRHRKVSPGRAPGCGRNWGGGAAAPSAPRVLQGQSSASGRLEGGGLGTPGPPPWAGPGCGRFPGLRGGESPRAGPDVSPRGRRPGWGGDRVSSHGSGHRDAGAREGRLSSCRHEGGATASGDAAGSQGGEAWGDRDGWAQGNGAPRRTRGVASRGRARAGRGGAGRGCYKARAGPVAALCSSRRRPSTLPAPPRPAPPT